MCAATGTPPALACTIGDLKPGQEFHDPTGETWMVLSLPSNYDGADADDTLVVNTGNSRGRGYNSFGRNNDELKGRVTPMRSSTMLGYDHKGMLYASTALNGWCLYADDLGRTWTPLTTTIAALADPMVVPGTSEPDTDWEGRVYDGDGNQIAGPPYNGAESD